MKRHADDATGEAQTKQVRRNELPPSLPDTCVVRNRYLDKLNAHCRDTRVYFDAGLHNERHDYYVDWHDTGVFQRGDSLSATSVVKAFFSEFDADRVILTMMNGKNWHKNKKYFGKTPDEIKAEWSSGGLESRTAGTEMHAFIDSYYNGERKLDDIQSEQIALCQFRNFVAEHATATDLQPYRSEWFIFTDDSTRITGSIDMVFVNGPVMNTLWKRVQYGGNPPDTLHVFIYDWKCSKEIKKYNKWERGIKPLGALHNANFYHYSIQLNVYKYILENFYHDVTWNGQRYARIEVDGMFLVCMHPRHKKFQLHRCPNYQTELQTIVQLRRDSLERLRKGLPALYPFDKSQPPPPDSPRAEEQHDPSDEYDFDQDP